MCVTRVNSLKNRSQIMHQWFLIFFVKQCFWQSFASKVKSLAEFRVLNMIFSLGLNKWQFKHLPLVFLLVFQFGMATLYLYLPSFNHTIIWMSHKDKLVFVPHFFHHRLSSLLLGLTEGVPLPAVILIDATSGNNRRCGGPSTFCGSFISQHALCCCYLVSAAFSGTKQ